MARWMASHPRASWSGSELKERIQRQAHKLYVQRGNQSGSELDDWLQAEEEIRRAKEQPTNES